MTRAAAADQRVERDSRALLREILRQHRLLAYCALTLAISWGAILLLIGPVGLALDEEHLAQLLGFGYLGMLVGPSLAAVLLTAAIDGRSGLRALWAETAAWRVNGRWWAIALLTAPVSIAVVLFALSIASPDYVPRLIVERDPAALLLYVAVSAPLTGVFEELGWTGFVARSLLGRHGILRTALIVGILMGAWNFLIVFLKELSVPTPGALSLVVLLAVGLLTWQVAFRILMVWVYERSHSVLLAMLMQTSLVAAWTSLTPLALERTTLVLFYLVLTVIWCALAVIAIRELASAGRATGHERALSRRSTG